MTVEFFTTQMDRMAGLRFVPASFDGHWHALQGSDPMDLEEAVNRALRTRVDFPVPAELFRDVQTVKQARLSVLPQPECVPLAEPFTVRVPHTERDLPITHTYDYHCAVCQDSGHEEFVCGDMGTRYPWLHQRRCDRPHSHGAHTWVKYCLCYASNPVVQARLVSGRR